jgi:hypothetical protein
MYVFCFHLSLFHFSLFLHCAPDARKAPSKGWWPCYLFYNILVYFHNTHQVLVELPRGVGDLFFSFFSPFYLFIEDNFYNTHQVLVGLPQGVGGLAILFNLNLSLF